MMSCNCRGGETCCKNIPIRFWQPWGKWPTQYDFWGTPYKQHPSIFPHRCPVCFGTGQILSGDSTSTAGQIKLTCPACHGTCIVWG